MSLFIFYALTAHRDLHSFPTRRSSDLHRSSRSWTIPCPEGRRHVGRVTRAAPGMRIMGTAAPPKPFSVRSEEHTSELQSHSDLVCRLLLEKKKRIRGHPSMQQTYY